jgi:hypothetical protein
MTSITAIFPRPREVTLGGRTFRVEELRLGDLADLQDWLDRGWECPLDGVRESLPAMDAAGRDDLLRGLWDDVEAGPPRWGAGRWRALFGTGAGILEIFRVALRRHHPEITGEDLVAVAERTSPAEYAAMRRVLFRVEPMDELEAWLEIEPDEAGRPIGWPQAVCEVAEAYPGWTLADIEGLTIGQFRALRLGGKPVERGTVVAPKTNLADVVKKVRAKFIKIEDGKGAG